MSVCVMGGWRAGRCVCVCVKGEVRQVVCMCDGGWREGRCVGVFV